MTRYLAARLPLTRIKLLIARILYVPVRMVLRTNHVTATRKGISYHLDLSEGIDLSIFVFGDFQNIVLKNNFYTPPGDAVIFDVGANIGSMALSFCKQLPQSHIHAFEPTDEAFGKLLRNINLNPELTARLTPVKCFVSDTSDPMPALSATASWKTNVFFCKGHPIGGGIVKPTGNAPGVSLDDYCLKQGIRRLDLIKIDTEGHELAVITGAKGCIRQFRPRIIFEAGRYLMNEHRYDFKDIEYPLSQMGYRFFSLQGGAEITRFNSDELIPKRSTIDIIALP